MRARLIHFFFGTKSRVYVCALLWAQQCSIVWKVVKVTGSKAL